MHFDNRARNRFREVLTIAVSDEDSKEDWKETYKWWKVQQKGQTIEVVKPTLVKNKYFESIDGGRFFEIQKMFVMGPRGDETQITKFVRCSETTNLILAVMES